MITYLMSFGDFINESLVGNKFYLKSQHDLRDLDFKDMRKNVSGRNIGGYSDYTYEKEFAYCFYVYKKLSHRKSGKLKPDLISPYSNYIWQINKPLNIFRFDKYNFKKISEKCPTWLPRIKYFFNFNDNDNIDIIIDKIIERVYRFDDSGSVDYNIFFDCINMESDDLNVFQQLYDGIEIPRYYKKSLLENEYLVFYRVLKDLKLIGGTEKLLGRKSDIDMVIPEYVIGELIRYTDKAGKKINLYVKKWLIENSPKPPDGTQIYRAFAMNLSDWGDYAKEKKWGDKWQISDALVNHPEKMKSYLYRRTGLKELDDFKRGNEIIIKRGKESSWSYNGAVSKQFADGMASSSINVLVKYNLKQSDVLLDFTLLPEKYKKEFKFKNQNEVILETGSYKGIIQEIWIDDKFEIWLNENGYKFDKRIGIFK